MRIQIAEAVDFGAADKAKIDAAGLQQAHDVVETAAGESASHIGRIAHSEDRFKRRPIADHAVFEDTDGARRMGFFGDSKAKERQTHADKYPVAVANFPRRSGDH